MSDLALVLSGGSTKIGLHVGAYKAIQEAGLEVSSFYGCSAGSIIAGFLASGMLYDELYDIYMRTDFFKFLKQSWLEFLWGIFFSPGVISGRNMMSFLNNVFKKTTLSETPKELHIMGHSLSKRSWVLLNRKTSPEMPVAVAIRISTSIPLLFRPYKYKKKCPHGEDYHYDWFVDGGLSKDFPIDLVPAGSEFIGHLIQAPNEYDWGKLTLKQMFSIVLDQLVQSNVEGAIRTVPPERGIIVRSNYNKSALDFKVSAKEKEDMAIMGYENMKQALSKWRMRKLRRAGR